MWFRADRARSEASATDGELFRALLEQGTLAIAVLDRAGRLTMMSRGLLELVGTAFRRVPAAGFPQAFRLYDVDGTRILRTRDVLGSALTGEAARDVVVSVRPPGQQVRYLRCSAAPLRGPQGRYVGSVVFVVDVTTEHLAVSRQDEIRRMLLDTVNHELRTPLTVVLANAELVTDSAADLPEELSGPLNAIVRASGRLRDTLQRVAELADLEALAQAERSNCNVAEILATAIGRRREEAEQRAVVIDLHCSTSLQWSLDRDLATKAVTALLDNAIRHGPDGGTVVVSACTEDDVLLLRVTDEGCGIADHDQERLTKPFERGSSGLDRQHASGFGLPLAQVVARSHQGALVFTRRETGFTASLVLA